MSYDSHLPPAGDRMAIENAAAALAALGHKLRFAAWRMLVPHGQVGLPAGAISAQLAVAPSSLSFHLQQMTLAGVLWQRRSSRQIIYAVNNQVMDALRDFLANAESETIGLPTTTLHAYPAGKQAISASADRSFSEMTGPASVPVGCRFASTSA
jgi:DNA-binding transcriptional ArsR family regulator